MMVYIEFLCKDTFWLALNLVSGFLHLIHVVNLFLKPWTKLQKQASPSKGQEAICAKSIIQLHSLKNAFTCASQWLLFQERGYSESLVKFIF